MMENGKRYSKKTITISIGVFIYIKNEDYLEAKVLHEYDHVTSYHKKYLNFRKMIVISYSINHNNLLSYKFMDCLLVSLLPNHSSSIFYSNYLHRSLPDGN